MTARVIAAAVLALCAGAASPAAGAAPAGCDPSRPAVAHFANGTKLRPQPGNAPVPCQSVVGRTSESADVGIGRTGSLFWAPLNENTAPPPQNTLEGPESVVRSRDGGRTWTPLDSGGPTTGGFVPPWMHVDPDTGRVWFTTTLPTLCGARVSWSDDDGDTWQTNPFVGCPAQGANKLIEGPPPAGGAKPQGYPHVVYHCSNGQDAAPSSVYCYRSVDGGRTFTAVGSPDPPRPEGCEEEHPARAGVVGPDGVLYFPTSVCGVLGVAISRDEGVTWEQRRIAETEVRNTYIATLAADRRGALYIAYLGRNDVPHLTTSRDRGVTWSRPAPVRAPGLVAARRVAVAANRAGQIALTYLGTADGTHYSGYVTTTANALAAQPRYWTATVNPPDEPLVDGTATEGFGDRMLYQTSTFAPDGTVLTGFHCVRMPACPDGRIGILGRLLAPSNRFRIARVTHPADGEIRRLVVVVLGPGRVVVTGRKLERVGRRVPARARVRLPIRQRGSAHPRSGKVHVTITYTPDGGTARSRTRTVRLGHD